MSKHNLELLAEAARLLKPLLGELVFVGGSTTAILITDKAAAEVRPTYDVDYCRDQLICRLLLFLGTTPPVWLQGGHTRRSSDLPVAAQEDHFGHHAAR